MTALFGIEARRCGEDGNDTSSPYAFTVLNRSISVIGCWGDSWKP